MREELRNSSEDKRASIQQKRDEFDKDKCPNIKEKEQWSPTTQGDNCGEVSASCYRLVF